jgi:hypothetical protein
VIVAYCDRCGEEIEAEDSAGCRLLLGKREWSWHLCATHREEFKALTEGFLTSNEWRVVK